MFLCLHVDTQRAFQHPSIAQEIKTVTTVHDAPLHRKLFVRPLSTITSSQTLRHVSACVIILTMHHAFEDYFLILYILVFQAFEEYGEIEEAIVIRDRVTRISKNYGFVTYRDIESVHDALREPRKAIDVRYSDCFEETGIFSVHDEYMNTEFLLFQGIVTVCGVARERKTSSDPESDSSLRRKLYVGDLPGGVTSENLLRDFQKHGEIEKAVVM